MRAFHETLGWIAVFMCGLVGLWGLVVSRKEELPRNFYAAVGVATGVMLLQVMIGVWFIATEEVFPGDQHTFYGLVIAVTFSFVYIYRAQFRKRPALAYGLLLLFVMGLGLRGIATFGENF